MQEASKRAIVAAFAANLGIAIAKGAGFVVTGSAGMLAEAGHSLADTGNQALLILGGRRAARKADREHPFGFGRERFFWAFVVALVLFSMGGLFALYEGIDKLRHPHETENLWVAVGILLVAIGLETFSLLTAVRAARQIKRNDVTWWQFIRHAKSPELPVVLLEDLGAEIGLVLALAGVVIADSTHDPRWDAVGSIGIGVLLVVIAGVLAVEMKGLLIGEAASTEYEEAISRAVIGHAKVVGLLHLRTQHIGPDELLVGAKVDFERSLDIAGLAKAINEVEAGVRAAVPARCVIYIEPDLRREKP